MKQHKMMSKRSRMILYFVIATLCTVFLAFPIYWMIMCSFKSQSEIFALKPTFWPHHFDLGGYQKMFGTKFTDQSVGQSLMNSVYIALITAVITTVLATLASYGLARFNYRINKPLLLVYLVAQMLPTVLFLAPLYLMFKKIGLLGTFLAPSIFVTLHSLPFSVLMLRPYFLNIPGELEDSAVIDGCNKFGAFLRIMLPMVYPGVVVIAILSFLWGWGDLVGALTFCATGGMQPLSLNMYRAQSAESTDWQMLMAFSTVIVVPATILFLALQKFIISGLTAGAVKG